MGNITATYPTFATLTPEKVAIHTKNQQIRYQKWNVMVNQTANWLNSLPTVNKTLGILLPNGIPFLQLFAGAARAGWVVVPYDRKWNLRELENKVKLSRPSVIVTTKEEYAQSNHMKANVRIVDEILQEISLFSSEFHEVEGNPLFYIGFTSGTTGNPKAFVRAHDSWVASFDCSRFDFELEDTDNVLIPGSFIHSHFLYGAISTLYLGGTVYLLEKFTPTEGMLWLETHPITALYVVPTMVDAFLKVGIPIDKPLKVISSGAKWSEKSKKAIRQLLMDVKIYEFYGAGEMSFVTVLADRDGRRKVGTVGRPCRGVEVQIRRSNQELAQPNETGKIYVKSKLLIDGYFEQPEGPIHTIQDEQGWATVDDIGYFDEDGFLYIAGREHNMILYGGINIFPEEIEKVLSLHSDVEEVAVMGIANDYWGQMVAAVVKGKSSSLELKRFCKKHLSSYKIPRKWFFRAEMPYTTSGKIARAKLRKQIESELTCNESSGNR